MKFINRERELNFLESKWQEKGAQLIVIWGKRRVGKTELIKQFIKNKPYIYFLSQSTNETDQLRRFSQEVGKFFNDPFLQRRGFGDWVESFEYIKNKSRKCILAIDEFPFLIQANRGIPSLFQKAWDEYWKDSDIFLILCGSSIGMMETEVLDYRAPLFGRRTGQWRLEPFNFFEATQFRPYDKFGEQVMYFAIAGGVPAYWLYFTKKGNFWESLRENVLLKGSPLYDEVEFLLREEFREPRYYFTILKAISEGKSKLSEIVNACGLSQSVVNKYLSVLSDLQIVCREIPITEPKPRKSKKGLYFIEDFFFNFWFRFIFPKRGELELGRINSILDDIKRNFGQYLSIVYERISKDILWHYQNRIFPFQKIGRWWDKNEEIDVVALNEETNEILFGEVKWSNKAVGINIYQDLKRKAGKVSWRKEDRKEYYALFSKSGYTSKMMKLAKEEGVYLFEKDKLIERG